MTESPQSHWKRITVEAAAIVGSILFAFAIDAWWDGVQSDQETREILDAVRLEMESNLSNLQYSIGHHEEIVESISTAVEQKSTDDVHRTAVVDVEVFELNAGALDTLIATGMLADIDDPALQISLGSFTRLARDLRERESRAVEFRDAARRRSAAIGEPIWDGLNPSLMLEDVQMLNLLVMRRSEEAEAIESARRLEDHLVKLLRQLEIKR